MNQINKKNIRTALEIITDSKTQAEAYSRIEKSGATTGLNCEVWFAYNSLPKK